MAYALEQVFDLVDLFLEERRHGEDWEAYLDRRREYLSSGEIAIIEKAIQHKWQDESPYQYLLAKKKEE